MTMPRPLLLGAAFLLALAGGSPAHAESAWLDWNDGLARASRADRPVLVSVYTDWCGWCRRMNRDVYEDASVKAYLEANFVTVRLNAEADQPAVYRGKDYTYRTLASGFRVTGYPTTIFLKADGSHLVNVPGFLPADQFLVLLKYVGEGHLEKGVPYAEYQRKHAAEPAP